MLLFIRGSDRVKVLVTGASGQLGYDVLRELNNRNFECLGTDIQDFDITDFEAVDTFLSEYKPNAVIHCSAYTAVDKAEEQPEKCFNVNVEGTEFLAKSCKKYGAKLIYISTDYVFDGEGTTEYNVDDYKAPLSVYGQTKLQGELRVQENLDEYFIIRISWAFGMNGNNFIRTMLDLGGKLDEVRVVSDQIGSPTYTADLACLLCDMVLTEKYGVYHATNEGFCSFAQLAQETFKQVGYTTKVNFIKSEEYPTKANRPLNSRLSKESLVLAGFQRLPHWQDAVHRYLKSINLI